MNGLLAMSFEHLPVKKQNSLVAIGISIYHLHGIEQFNYSNMKLNEWTVNLKLLCNLWAFLSVLFIKCCVLGLKVSRNQSNNITWCTMTANTVKWLRRALERDYLIIKIRIDGVKERCAIWMRKAYALRGFQMSKEALLWCLDGNLWHRWWGAVGLRCESSIHLSFHASLLYAWQEEQ